MPGKPAAKAVSACLELVQTARVMSLAVTGDETTGPWSAPVYFVFDAGRFYFFSSPKSRHILAGEDRMCAASIFRDSQHVEELLGVQMTGRIKRYEASAAAMKTAVAYAGKYGIGHKADNVFAYLSKVFHAAFYGFVPEEIWFMDNRIGFGNREPVRL